MVIWCGSILQVVDGKLYILRPIAEFVERGVHVTTMQAIVECMTTHCLISC